MKSVPDIARSFVELASFRISRSSHVRVLRAQEGIVDNEEFGWHRRLIWSTTHQEQQQPKQQQQS
jgi:hypothetical protein